MDTSKTSAYLSLLLLQNTTFLQMNQKSIYENDDDDDNEDGQKTPPSTGSSARRQKLQLMREQAGYAVATAVDDIGSTATATATATATCAGTGAVDDTSAGPPATAAFADAISGATTTTNIASGPPHKTLTATTTAAATAGLPPPGSKSSDVLPPSGKIAGLSSVVPPSTTVSLWNESQSRLEEAYAKSERDKTVAFLKVQDLELQLRTKMNEEFDRAIQQKQLRHAPAVFFFFFSTPPASSKITRRFFSIPSFGVTTKPSNNTCRLIPSFFFFSPFFRPTVILLSFKVRKLVL